MIIADLGSGNTCGNSWDYTKKMIDALAEVDKKRKCIIKWQLFKECGANLPLSQRIFSNALCYAETLGFKTTASVFDKETLEFLLGFDVPFVKIPNRRDLDWLIGEIPRRIPIIKSVGFWEWDDPEIDEIDLLACISKYPATIEDYEIEFRAGKFDYLKKGISDHTSDWILYKKYRPMIEEVHFCLDDSTGLDAGPFARRPNQMKEIL